jgi:probable F420-dependent oxidoreductase
MEFGFSIPARGPLADSDSIAAIARRGEALGFEIISVSDHIVVPTEIDSRYPYSATGEFTGAGSGDYLEQLIALSYLAAVTSSVRLLTSVIVLPHRNPIVAAKALASIDVLSKGRLIVGCGVGWMREEFEAVGTPPYEERGAVGNEYIRAFKELWTSENPSFSGKYCNFRDITFLPKPVQKPHPPLWIGGESPPALRRAGQLGDAWFPIGNNPVFPVGTVEQLTESMSRVRKHAEEAGRDPSEIYLAYSAGWYDDMQAHSTPDGDRQLFTGSPEQVAEDIKVFEELGVRHLMLNFQGPTLAEMEERMERFATVVRPLAVD